MPDPFDANAPQQQAAQNAQQNMQREEWFKREQIRKQQNQEKHQSGQQELLRDVLFRIYANRPEFSAKWNAFWIGRVQWIGQKNRAAVEQIFYQYGEGSIGYFGTEAAIISIILAMFVPVFLMQFMKSVVGTGDSALAFEEAFDFAFSHTQALLLIDGPKVDPSDYQTPLAKHQQPYAGQHKRKRDEAELDADAAPAPEVGQRPRPPVGGE